MAMTAPAPSVAPAVERKSAAPTRSRLVSVVFEARRPTVAVLLAVRSCFFVVRAARSGRSARPCAIVGAAVVGS